MVEQHSDSRPRFPRDSRAAAPGTRGHDEWLIDESIAETFPASDPTSPVRPGSIVGLRNSVHGATGRAVRQWAYARRSSRLWATVATAVVSAFCAFLVLRSRDG